MYEACLLYQGALSTWQTVGYPDVCPNISNNPVSDQSAIKKVTREDALRAPKVACFSYLYATQVAAAVPVLISSADREFLNLNGAFAEPGTNPDLCIEARHGICGNQTWVGIELLKLADLKARPVEFYYNDEGQRLNHVIPEVLIDGGWRPIDTTYGGYWIDSTPGVPFALRTLEEVLDKSISGTKLMRNRALLPYAFYEKTRQFDPFSYLHADAAIIRGGEGTITLSLTSKRGTETFQAIPNFLGDNVRDGNSIGVSYKFKGPIGNYKVTVNVAGTGQEGDQPIRICLDGSCRNFSSDQHQYQFLARQPKSLTLKSDADVAYVVLQSIEWDREDQ
ncbi:hypothetical protein BRSPCE3_47950 [Bradyrhizobium sp. Ce-3]|nr:hypothetical protein BRSPCE3_47950 [Bradyrhizobium sp. Ce-3]